MTWTRIATAAILIPVVVALVLFTPTSIVAIATAIITILALREYLALGAAIGHRAYRLWTIFCSLLLILVAWRAATRFVSFSAIVTTITSIAVPYSPLVPDNALQIHRTTALYSPGSILFLFVLGLTALTLWTRRPIVEALPAAGISTSALLLVAFPLSFAVKLHGVAEQGPRLLLFALVVTWAADTFAYFAGRSFGKHSLAPHISPKKTWEGSAASMIGSLLVAYAF